MTDHPITPPPELVQEWIQEADGGHDPRWQEYEQDIADRSAQWGYDQRGKVNEAELQEARDQELEACIAWMKKMCYWREDGQAIPLLRAARRPKPPSLKEQALKAAHIELDPQGKNGSLIICALEALPDD